MIPRLTTTARRRWLRFDGHDRWLQRNGYTVTTPPADAHLPSPAERLRQRKASWAAGLRRFRHMLLAEKRRSFNRNPYQLFIEPQRRSVP
jgi:hypothetical protein